MKFIDAGGDKVTVTLKGALEGDHQSFNITLDERGPAITPTCNRSSSTAATAPAALAIAVTPQKIKLPEQLPGHDQRQALHLSSGSTKVAMISSSHSLKGISATAAAHNIVIGSATSSANIGGIAIDLGSSKLFAASALDQVTLGNVTDYGHIGSIVLHGSSNITNNLVGTIAATAGIDFINAPYSIVGAN